MVNHRYIYIWDANIYGIKRDFNPTVKKARALAQQKAEPSASLLRFADTAYSRSDLKKLDPAVVHYLQHLEERIISSKTAAFMVALHEHEPHGQSLLNILMIAAIKSGLVLCDEVAELVILSDGSIWSTDEQLIARLKESTKFPATLKQYYRLLQKDVGNLLMQHGFLADKQESWSDHEFYVRYNKAIKMGKLSLFIGFERKKECFEPYLHFEIIEEHMVAIAQKSDFDLREGLSLNVFPILNINSDEFCIDGWKKFEELLSLLEDSVLRWSDAITDIKGIDTLLNGDADEAVKNEVSSHLYTPYALIAARLAGNPNFEELALDLGAYGPDSGRNWGMFGYSEIAVGWPKLVNYLREEIKPLADWPEGFLACLQGKEARNDTTAAPITMEQLDEHFKIKMGELASSHGFVLTKLTELREDEDLKCKYFIVVYDKAIDMGKLSLEVRFRNFSPSIGFTITETAMMKIAERFNFSNVVDWKEGIVLNISPTLENREAEVNISSWQKLEELLSLLRNSVMHWSDSINNIKGIEALLNGGEIDTTAKYTHSRYLYNLYAIIAARLAGNPCFEELSVLLAPYGAGKSISGHSPHTEIAAAWPTLVNYLRDEIKPLVDTSADAVLPAHFVCSNLERLIDPHNQKGFPTILVQFADLVQNQAKELFMEHGFVLIEETNVGGNRGLIYGKAIKTGKLFLRMSFEEKRGAFKATINYQVIEDNMIVIAQQSDFSYAMVQNGLFLNLNGVLNPKEQIWIHNWTTFEALLHLLKETVLKWSDTIDDIKGIDALINGDTNEAIKNNVHSSCYTPFALITARLANNPNFEDLAVSLGTYGAGSGRAWGKFSHAEVAVAWPKLVQYLRDEVKPLV